MKAAGIAGRIILVLLLAALAAGWIWRRELLRLVLPDVEKFALTDVRVTNDTAYMNLVLTVKNNGLMTYRLKQMRLDVVHDTVAMLRLRTDSLHVLKANETRDEPFRIALPYKKVIRRIRSLQGQDSTLIELRGALVFDTFAGDVEVPVERFIRVRVPTPPEVYLREVVYLGKDDAGNRDLQLKLTLVNHNNVVFAMRDVTYDFHTLQDIEGHGSVDSIYIKAKDSTRVTVPVKVTVGSDLKLAAMILLDNDMVDYHFRMRGTITSVTGLVKKDEIPAEFTTKGRAEILKERKTDVKFTIRKDRKKRKDKNK